MAATLESGMGANNQSQVERMEAKVNVTNSALENRISGRIPANPYHDTPEKTQGPDVLEQFRQNLSQLEDLHGRLRFVLSEIKSAIKRS